MKRHFFVPYWYKPCRGNCQSCGKKAQDKIHLFKGTDFDYAIVAKYFNWSIDDKRATRFVELMKQIQERFFPSKKTLLPKNKWIIIKTAKEELDREIIQQELLAKELNKQ